MTQDRTRVRRRANSRLIPASCCTTASTRIHISPEMFRASIKCLTWFSEMLVIAVVALIVIGPERLPKVARTLGHLFGRMQRYVNDVKADISREMELDELRKLQTTIQDAAQSIEQSGERAKSTAAESELRTARARRRIPIADPAPTPAVDRRATPPAAQPQTPRRCAPPSGRPGAAPSPAEASAQTKPRSRQFDRRARQTV